MAGTSKTCVDTPLVYSNVASSLLGINKTLLVCHTGAFKGEPLLAVLVREIFSSLVDQDVQGQKLEITPNWFAGNIGQPPMSCAGLDNCTATLVRNSWYMWYDRMCVSEGAIGRGVQRVFVLDKSGRPCGIETVRLVARKAICQDVKRAVIYSMVHVNCWSLVVPSGSPVPMQQILDSQRRQGMVQVLADLIVQNFCDFTRLMCAHFLKHPLKTGADAAAQKLFEANCGVQCSVGLPTQTLERKRPRGMLDEMSSLYTLVQDLQDCSSDEADTCSRNTQYLRLKLQVLRFLDKAITDRRIARLDAGREMKVLRSFVRDNTDDEGLNSLLASASHLDGPRGRKRAIKD